MLVECNNTVILYNWHCKIRFRNHSFYRELEKADVVYKYILYYVFVKWGIRESVFRCKYYQKPNFRFIPTVLCITTIQLKSYPDNNECNECTVWEKSINHNLTLRKIYLNAFSNTFCIGKTWRLHYSHIDKCFGIGGKFT